MILPFPGCGPWVEPLMNDLKKNSQMVVKIGSFFGGGGQRHMFQVAQGFQAVAKPVDIVGYRQDVQLAPLASA